MGFLLDVPIRPPILSASVRKRMKEKELREFLPARFVQSVRKSLEIKEMILREGTPRLFLAKSAQTIEKTRDELTLFGKRVKE